MHGQDTWAESFSEVDSPNEPSLPDILYFLVALLDFLHLVQLFLAGKGLWHAVPGRARLV